MVREERRITSLLPAAVLALLASCASDWVVGTPPPPPPPPPRSDGAGNMLYAGDRQYIEPPRARRVCGREISFCALLRPDPDGAWRIHVSEGAGPERRVATLPPLPPMPFPGHRAYDLSSLLIRETTGAWIIGVDRLTFSDDPRGYGSARHRLLFRLAPGSSEAVEILDVPVAGSVTTRYCSRGDHDHPPTPGCVVNHTLSATMNFDFDNPAGPPRFVLNARAEIYPGRPVPSSTPGRTVMHLRDPDPTCTYHRLFTRDSATGRYVADAPLPDCVRYFDLDRWREWVTDVVPQDPKAR